MVFLEHLLLFFSYSNVSHLRAWAVYLCSRTFEFCSTMIYCNEYKYTIQYNKICAIERLTMVYGLFELSLQNLPFMFTYPRVLYIVNAKISSQINL